MNEEYGVEFSNNIAWTFSYGDPIVNQPLIYENLLFTQTTKKLFANDLKTGELIWQTRLPIDDNQTAALRTVPIAINENYIALQTQKNTVAVFALETGHLLWSSSISPVASEVFSASGAFIKDIEIYNNVVYVSRHNTDLVAYNALDGDVVWSKSVPSRTDLDIMIENPNLYLGTIDSIITYKLDNGQVVNEKKLDGSVWNFYKDGDFIYVVFMNGPCSFVAIELLDLDNKWCINFSEISHLHDKARLVSDSDNVYIAGNKLLTILKHTGKVLWLADAKPWATFQSPVIQDFEIFVSDGDFLHEFDKNYGREIGRAKFISEFSDSDMSLINENMIYIIDNSSVKVIEILHKE